VHKEENKMQKPAWWDETTAIKGGGERLPAGGYPCTIIGGAVTQSRKGKEMLVLWVDVAEGEYAGLFVRQYKQRKQSDADAKYPAGGTYYQLTGLDGEPNNTQAGRFKGLVEILKASNPGWNWNFDVASLKGLMFGGVFREEEYESTYDGTIKTTTKIAYINELEGIEDVSVPAKKELEQKGYGGGNTYVDDETILP